MKTQIIALFCIFITTISLTAQIPYYDAIKLKDQARKNGVVLLNQNTTVFQVLEHYIPGERQEKSEVIKAFENNPFVRIDVAGSPQSGSFMAGEKNLINAVSGLDVTAFSQGLSQFMINRAKEELNAAFFNRFKKFMTEHPELTVLFPQTNDVLQHLVSYHYAEMLPTLREAFQEDMAQLGENIVHIVDLEKYHPIFQEHPEMAVVMRTFSLLSTMEHGSHPEEAIQQIMAFPELKNSTHPSLHNIYAGLQLQQVLSNSIKTKAGHVNQQQWVPFKEFNHNIFQDSTAFTIFLGLVWQQIKTADIYFYRLPDTTQRMDIAGIMADQAGDITAYHQLFFELVRLTEAADKQLATIRHTMHASRTANRQQIAGYAGTSMALLSFGTKAAKTMDPQLDFGKNPHWILAEGLHDLFQRLLAEQYGMAVNHTARIFEQVAMMTGQNTNKDVQNIRENSVLFNLENIKKFTSYGQFMVNVIDAQTPGEVEAAISAAALPAGSSAIKKHARFNLAVNGYLGASYRLNEISGAGSKTNAWNSTWAVSAPVGLTVSTGMGKAGSLSLTGVVIDVGAIVDYQLSNDSTRIESNITLGNIFSPGVYITYGMAWDLPLSIGIGMQYGPGLSGINTSNQPVINAPNVRWSLLLAVDIPFFNLYHVP